MPLERFVTRNERTTQLESLALSCLGLADPAQIPAKLAIAPEEWQRFLAVVAEEQLGEAAPLLARLYRIFHAVGAAERYLAVMQGLRFPPEAAEVRWRRRLGPSTAAEEHFEQALGKLRLEACGLHVKRRVEIAGAPVDWAIAGLLHDGSVLRVAVQVRPAPPPLEALREDLADDAIAAAGFQLLAFRDWQLRYAGACALHVAAFLREQAPFLRFPAKLHDPDDDHPIHRLQASPMRLTPRQASPNWQLREGLRAEHPELSGEALLSHYEASLIERSRASAEDEEWVHWG